jgi:hypothetical protein
MSTLPELICTLSQSRTDCSPQPSTSMHIRAMDLPSDAESAKGEPSDPCEAPPTPPAWSSTHLPLPGPALSRRISDTLSNYTIIPPPSTPFQFVHEMSDDGSGRMSFRQLTSLGSTHSDDQVMNTGSIPCQTQHQQQQAQYLQIQQMQQIQQFHQMQQSQPVQSMQLWLQQNNLDHRQQVTQSQTLPHYQIGECIYTAPAFASVHSQQESQMTATVQHHTAVDVARLSGLPASVLASMQPQIQPQPILVDTDDGPQIFAIDANASVADVRLPLPIQADGDLMREAASAAEAACGQIPNSIEHPSSQTTSKPPFTQTLKAHEDTGAKGPRRSVSVHPPRFDQSIFRSIDDDDASVVSPPSTANSQLAGLQSSPLSTPTSASVKGKGISKTSRGQRRYSQASPSKFCHICQKGRKATLHVTCANIQSGTCRKVICVACFTGTESVAAGWEWDAATGLGSKWTCPHCAGKCPSRAQCVIYSRTNERRREGKMKKRQPPRAATAAVTPAPVFQATELNMGKVEATQLSGGMAVSAVVPMTSILPSFFD